MNELINVTAHPDYRLLLQGQWYRPDSDWWQSHIEDFSSPGLYGSVKWAACQSRISHVFTLRFPPVQLRNVSHELLHRHHEYQISITVVPMAIRSTPMVAHLMLYVLSFDIKTTNVVKRNIVCRPITVDSFDLSIICELDKRYLRASSIWPWNDLLRSSYDIIVIADRKI